MPLLPLAVTVGFSGPCQWFSEKEHLHVDSARYQEAAKNWLVERLKGLPDELGLADHHFLSGISQIAVGGDHAFTEACQELGIPQRISLPQPSDVFLSAVGSKGPDFPEIDKQHAIGLLSSPHIIREQVASAAALREDRFEETNIELVRESDLIIAMVKADGGRWTRDLILRAARWNTPVLVVNVSLKDGQPDFEAAWQGLEAASGGGFKAPTHPDVLAKLPLEFAGTKPLEPHAIPPKNDYFLRVKNHCSGEAGRLNHFFESSAKVIIGGHFYATVCAVLSLVLLKDCFQKWAYYPTLAVLLAAEIGFLIYGYRRHHRLHEKHAAAHWAMNRLLSEVARSVIAFGQYHVGFSHLRLLNLPDECRALLRTMEILQLRETRLQTCKTWEECRDDYVKTRLTGKNSDPELRRLENGPQINYYRKEAAKAELEYHRAHKIFTVASLSAIAATSFKFVLVAVVCFHHELHPDVLKSVLGFFGVLLPVVAVAALSLAAAKDLEARSHTFKEMHGFLVRQAELIKAARSEREFSILLNETESRLLGENATWFSRRTFTGIA